MLAWAARLGTFLARRVHRAGKDDRFDDLKPSIIRFLGVWTIQGLWVTLTAAAAWVSITSATRVGLDWFTGSFISTGLWGRSRHPNYFGEIVLWTGVAMIALPTLQGWQWVALVSPLFVTLLLTKVSGVPLLERKADSKGGGQPDYEAYKASTPVLIPRLR